MIAIKSIPSAPDKIQERVQLNSLAEAWLITAARGGRCGLGESILSMDLLQEGCAENSRSMRGEARTLP